MNIPAPTPLENRRSFAVSAPFGWIPRELLPELDTPYPYPVFMHQLGSEAVRQKTGPRELALETIEGLEKIKWSKMWGLGGVCRSVEEAAQFATAGYTWFKLDLHSHLDLRYQTMTLEELDAAIVRLEDEGILEEDWHAPYTSGNHPKLTDEVIARWGVRFGLALKEAEQMIQAIRMNTPLRGELPDLEFSFAGAQHALTAMELEMLIFEMSGRGFFHDMTKRIAPSFGPTLEAGTVELAEVPPNGKEWWDANTPIGTMFAIPSSVTEEAIMRNAHRDFTEASNFLWLRHLATTEPDRFREWCEAARIAFPTSKVGHHLSIGEEDVRFLPQVPNDALVTTFLENSLGRQLLASTWQDVSDLMRSRTAA